MLFVDCCLSIVVGCLFVCFVRSFFARWFVAFCSFCCRALFDVCLLVVVRFLFFCCSCVFARVLSCVACHLLLIGGGLLIVGCFLFVCLFVLSLLIFILLVARMLSCVVCCLLLVGYCLLIVVCYVLVCVFTLLLDRLLFVARVLSCVGS